MDASASLTEAEMDICDCDGGLAQERGFPAGTLPGDGGRRPQTYGVRGKFVQQMAWFSAALLLAFTLCLMPGMVGAQAQTRILALGDSLTAGFNLPADAMFPAVLERKLRAAGHNVEVINAGVSGDTAQGGLERLDWALGDKVDAAIVELGANDMLRGIDPAATEKSLDAI